MEGLVLRQPLTCGTGASAAASSSSKANKFGSLRVGRNKKESESEFRENGHLQFYQGGGNKKSIKQKLKLLKSLSKFSSADNQHALLLQETAQGLMTYLQDLKAKHKEKRKLAKLKSKSQSSSSSSSSESSDSDGCIDMTSLRNQAALQPLPTRVLSNSTAIETDQTQRIEVRVPSIPIAIETDQTKRIEVCMGNKCKKLGAGVLLEEFERVLGGEAAVVGCKCMGKCRDGPNVRLRNSAAVPPAPLCVGVALEDIHVIASNLLGELPSSVS